MFSHLKIGDCLSFFHQTLVLIDRFFQYPFWCSLFYKVTFSLFPPSISHLRIEPLSSQKLLRVYCGKTSSSSPLRFETTEAPNHNILLWEDILSFPIFQPLKLLRVHCGKMSSSSHLRFETREIKSCWKSIEEICPPLPPLLPICLSTSELGSLSWYSFKMKSFQFTWNSFLYFRQPSISLPLSGDDKESAEDADPAEHHHHHDQGEGQAALCGGDIKVKSQN